MHSERCFKDAVFVSKDVSPKRLLNSLRSSVGEIKKYSQDVFVYRCKELSVVKEVFRRQKGDFILSDGRSETKRPVLPGQLPLEILTESNIPAMYFASWLRPNKNRKIEQKILFYR